MRHILTRHLSIRWALTREVWQYGLHVYKPVFVPCHWCIGVSLGSHDLELCIILPWRY